MEKFKLGEETCKICKAKISIEIYSNRSKEELMEDYKVIKDYIENLHWYNNHYDCAICGKWIAPKERDLLYGELLNIPFHEDYIPEKVGIERVHKKCLKELIKNKK